MSTGGDYAPEEGNYVLNAGDTEDCLEVLVFSDNLFEAEESFGAQLIGLIDDSGRPVSSQEGVTLNPTTTRVVIGDTDRECVCVCVREYVCVLLSVCACMRIREYVSEYVYSLYVYLFIVSISFRISLKVLRMSHC